MKRICMSLLAGCLLLCGCSSSKETTKIKLMTPQGATALATISIYDSAYAEVTTVNGSDPLTAELAKENSEYDVIIAPINAGAKMIEKGSTNYRMAAVITWGNLYLVANENYQKGDPIVAFGENAVPQKILETTKLADDVTYFSGVQDAQAQLLGKKANAALLAEPAVSATLAKAKESGLQLSVVSDLQEQYALVQGNQDDHGYPQAAVFVKIGSEESVEPALEEMKNFLNEGAADQEKVKSLIETIQAENLGVPNANIAVASWERQNLSYKDAKDVKEQIASFLSLFQITFTDEMLSK